MKKLLPILLITLSFNANARGNFVAPLIGGLIGGVIIGEMVTRPPVPTYPQPYVETPVYIQPNGYYQVPPPVYYPQPQIYYPQYNRGYYYDRH